jgi:predicted transcriptional regulator
MTELSTERIGKILHEETASKEELATILRGVYTRYMHLYERYFADIDALKDDKIAELRNYHEETRSFVKYYYLDIPLDTCTELEEFDKEYTEELLGPEWNKYLLDRYKEYKRDNKSKNKSEETFKAEFAKHTLSNFYDVMDYVFRDSFSTNSETAKDMESGLIGMLFGDHK